MKKIIGLAVATLFAVGAMFAMGKYNGDIEAHIGVGFDSVTATSTFQTGSNWKTESKQKLGSALFEIDIASWNLFDINDFFSFGFMANLNGGFGGMTKFASVTTGAGSSETYSLPKEYRKGAAHFTGLFGPAIGINVGDTICLNLGLGLAFGCTGFTCGIEDYLTDITMGGAGFGANLQAKILPKNKISPVVGYRFAVIPSKKFTYTDKKTGEEMPQSFDSVTYVCNQLYIGVAYNF